MTRAVVDLHLHTTASDGRLTPTQLVELLEEKGIRVAAITDHDSTEGLAEAYVAAQRYPQLALIPGVELSTDVPGNEIHLLGYLMDYEDPGLHNTLGDFREAREVRARGMVEKLNAMGINITWERVQQIAGDGAIGRPHIARAMLEKGYIRHPNEAFESYIGRNGPAYVERPKLTPEEAVRLVAKVGGVPVLAHPAELPNLEGWVERLKAVGLVGMEVHYAQYTPETRERLANLARAYGLLSCGGTDYHAMGTPGEPVPGDYGPPLGVAQELIRLVKTRARQLR